MALIDTAKEEAVVPVGISKNGLHNLVCIAVKAPALFAGVC